MDTTKITRRLATHGYVAALWHIDDVRELRPDLTDEQCMEVLHRADHKHDAGIGINWDVLRYHADHPFPQTKEAGV